MTFRKMIASVLVSTALLVPVCLESARAQLPPEVEADRLLLIARDSMEAKEWGKARQAFEDILALGIAVPPDFHYHYARALSQSGRPAQAKEQLTLYLRNADRGSPLYRDALTLFNTVDAAAKRAEENRKREAAIAAKQAEDARKAAAEAEQRAKATRQKIAEAEAGSADAQEAVGVWYMYGTNGVKRDYAEARKWLERAAAQEHGSALSGLAFLYVNGWGVNRDYVKARDYYLRAARKNNVEAFHGLGVMYKNGHGVKKDVAIAAQWYQKGADAGLAESQNNLAILYLRGEGVPQNRDIAYQLLLKAGKQGHKYARETLQKHFSGYYRWD